MNWADVLLMAIVLISVWVGYRNGFVMGSVGLVKWAGSLLLAFFFYPYTAQLFERWLPAFNVWKLPLAFLLTFFTAFFLISSLLNVLIKNLPHSLHNSRLNRVLGIFPGFISGLINASVAALLLLSLALWDGLMNTARNSRLTEDFAKPAQWLEERLKPVFNEAIDQTMTRLTVKPGSGENVKLPYRDVQGSIRSGLEARMLQMVNKEREKEGLGLLKADPEMTKVARGHSKDMFARGYFSHYTPEGLSPFDRMKNANISYRTAGENLALAPTLETAHEGLMNSPGHRANILNPAYRRLGIGILDGGKYGFMIAQEFRN